jgi:hypothetical protein
VTGDIEVYFTEDRCGLLFLEAHRHLKHLAEATAHATASASLFPRSVRRQRRRARGRRTFPAQETPAAAADA